MGDEYLEALLIKEIAKIPEGGGHNKNEQDGGQDDGHLNPLFTSNEGQGQKKDIAGEGDKEEDEEDILGVEREGGDLEPDGEHDDINDQEGKDPPDAFHGPLMLANV